MPFSLKMMCWNIAAARESSVERIANYIKDQKPEPDIVLLQEVKLDESPPRDLSQGTGLNNYYFAPDSPDTSQTAGGHMILSRYPFYPKAVHYIKDGGSILETIFNVPSVNRLRVYNTHFSPKYWELRMEGAKLITSLIKNVMDPIIFGGDLNTYSPGSDPIDGYTEEAAQSINT